MLSGEMFVGLWDVFSGQSHTQLVINPDGSYALSAFAGMQQFWGMWALEDRGGQPCLVQYVQNSNPPMLMAQLGLFGSQDVHAIMNVQPNQVQLYDALLIRRVIPQMAWQGPAQPTNSGGLNWLQNTPVGLPPVSFSAPPPVQQPASHATPMMTGIKQQNVSTNDQVRAIYDQIYADHNKTMDDINTANLVQSKKEFDAQQAAIKAQTDQAHKNAQTFINTVLKH